MNTGVYAGTAVGFFVLGSAFGPGLDLAIELVPPRAGESSQTHVRARLAAVTVLTGLGFLLAFLQFRLSARLPLACFFIMVMIVISLIDWELTIIPDKIALPAAAIGLAAAIALDPRRWWVYLAASLGSSLFLLILALVWPNGMGGGDIKLALFMGGVLGSHVIVGMFLAFLFGSLVGIILVVTKVKKRKDAIPFGPYLALGSVLALLYGPFLVDAYLGLLG